MIDYKTIEVYINEEENLGLLYFNRPKSLNAFNYELVSEFCEALSNLAEQSLIKCLVISGKGSVFSVGGDIKEFEEANDPVKFMSKLAEKLHEGIHLIKNIGIPVIAAINGACFGAALGYACSCDLRYCNESARFGAAFTGIGLSPDSSTSFQLPRIVGQSLATEMILLNRVLNSEEAEYYRLVNKRFSSSENLVEMVKEIAVKLANGPFMAYRGSKQLLLDAFNNDLSTHLKNEAMSIKKCAGTYDFKEGINAFLEKRSPSFKKEED
jgi:2-(1,2-epoxy-1,2-dihydrophenyl)acetyl-CoA isomerase